MNKRNCISSLCVLAFFAFFYVEAQSLKEGAAYWPKLACVVGMGLSAVNAIIAALKWGRDNKASAFFPLTEGQARNSLILLVIASAWIFLITRIGYLSSSILATGAIVLLFEPARGNIPRDTIITLIFSLSIYLLFSLLGVHFSKGLLM